MPSHGPCTSEVLVMVLVAVGSCRFSSRSSLDGMGEKGMLSQTQLKIVLARSNCYATRLRTPPFKNVLSILHAYKRASTVVRETPVVFLLIQRLMATGYTHTEFNIFLTTLSLSVYPVGDSGWRVQSSKIIREVEED